MPKVVAVILHYENEEMTNQCIESFKKTAPNVELLVVDNFSTFDYKREDVTVIRNDNRMSVSGINLGLLHALYQMQADFVINSDNDIICLDGWLEPLLKAFEEHPQVGIAGGKQWNPDRTHHRSVGADLIGGHLAGDAPNTQETVFWIQGSFVMMRAEMMRKIGVHDDRFEIVCSDSDYCIHAWDRGWQVMFVPESEVIHVGNGSYGKKAVDTWKSDNTKLIQKWYGIKSFEFLENFPYDTDSKKKMTVKYELA